MKTNQKTLEKKQLCLSYSIIKTNHIERCLELVFGVLNLVNHKGLYVGCSYVSGLKLIIMYAHILHYNDSIVQRRPTPTHTHARARAGAHAHTRERMHARTHTQTYARTHTGTRK